MPRDIVEEFSPPPFAKLVTPAPASETDEVLRLLIEWRALIAHGWCQRSYAQDAEGRGVELNSERAVKFCTAGALYRIKGRYPAFVRTRVRELLIEAVPPDFRPSALSRHIQYSDANGRTHAEVIAMGDRAIAARRSALVS